MTITIRREGDQQVILGQPEPVEYFSTKLLAEADGDTIAVDGDLIVLRDNARTITYRQLSRPSGAPPSDNEFVAAELVSDTDAPPG